MPKDNGTPEGEGNDNSYKVGYCKPPLHTRFKKGQPGRKGGRRKGVRNLKTDVMRALGMKVKVKAGGRTQKRSTQEGALMVLREKALKGDPRSLDRLLELAMRFNDDSADQESSQRLPAEDEAILAAYISEMTMPNDKDPGGTGSSGTDIG